MLSDCLLSAYISSTTCATWPRLVVMLCDGYYRITGGDRSPCLPSPPAPSEPRQAACERGAAEEASPRTYARGPSLRPPTPPLASSPPAEPAVRPPCPTPRTRLLERRRPQQQCVSPPQFSRTTCREDALSCDAQGRPTLVSALVPSPGLEPSRTEVVRARHEHAAIRAPRQRTESRLAPAERGALTASRERRRAQGAE